MDNYVIGIDPGKTTGLVVLAVTDLVKRGYHIAAKYALLWSDRYRIKDVLSAFNNAGNILAIVMEDFRLYEHKAMDQVNSDFPSPKVIERTIVYCEELALTHLIEMPMASTLYKQKGLKWSIPSDDYRLLPSPHMRDAYLHARIWILRQRFQVIK